MFSQLPLPLPFKPALSREDFLVSPCNAAAVATIESSDLWPNGVAILCGPRGSGKSHLSAVWQDFSGAVGILAPSVTTDLVAERLTLDKRNVIVEQADERRDETALFHLINDARDHGYSVLFTCCLPVAKWGVQLPDLSSRLAAAAQAFIKLPDESLLAAVLIKQLADKHVQITPRVLDYIIPRVGRSFAEIRTLAEEINHATLVQKKPVTLPLVRSILMQKHTPERVYGSL